MSFLLFLVRFLEKREKKANLEIYGVLRRCVGIPRSSVGPPQGMVCPRRDMAEKEVWKALGMLQRSTIHNMENFGLLSCFVIPLFRGLVYWTNENPVSV